MAISNQATKQVDQEVDRTAMARMLDLRNVLELINNRFHDGAFAQEKLIQEGHEFVFHIGADTSD